MSLVYAASLLVALAALVLLDRRFRLVFWRGAGRIAGRDARTRARTSFRESTRRATVVLVVGLLFFLAWDASGIALGVFARGGSRFMTGIDLAPELPVEEVFFLAFLCYLTLILLFGSRLLLDRRSPG